MGDFFSNLDIMPFVPNDGKANKCTKCAKTVYPNEAIRAANGVYHKGCLRCTQCNITLNLKSCMSHESKPYCNTRPKAGHTQVASVEMQSALKAPKAANKVQGISKDARMTFAPRGGRGGPRAAPAASSYKGPNTVKVGGGGNKCPGCGKTVYTNEEIVACAGRWHKGCLKCEVCKITLNLKSIQSHQNKPYCKTHFPKVGHTQVASVEMQNAMKAPKAAIAVKGVNKTARATFAPGALNPVSGADIVNKGGVASSDVQSRNAPTQNFVAPEPTPHMEYDTPDEQFSGMTVSGGDQGGYDEGYAEEAYDQGGYDEGYAEEGYAEEGYAEGGYDEGYDEEGYDEGYYEEGYDEGYDEGYYEEGY